MGGEVLEGMKVAVRVAVEVRVEVVVGEEVGVGVRVRERGYAVGIHWAAMSEGTGVILVGSQ
jgi:uncharacterized protein YebE (UPF0316 family)